MAIVNPPNFIINQPGPNYPVQDGLMVVIADIMHRIVQNIDAIEDPLTFLIVICCIFVVHGLFIFVCTVLGHCLYKWYNKRKPRTVNISTTAEANSKSKAKSRSEASTQNVINNYNNPHMTASAATRRSTRNTANLHPAIGN